MGYIEWEKIFSFKGICNALACVFAFLFLFSLTKVYRSMKNCKFVEQMVFSYALLSFAFNIFVCTITNNILSRYIMASIVPSIYFLIFLESSSIYRKIGGYLRSIIVDGDLRDIWKLQKWLEMKIN